MIKPIMARCVSFKADDVSRDKNGEYTDPLMHWPLRGAAFTNEIGEALRPLIGGYATLSWVPALMYIGADIYDKYKNEQTEFSPDTNRALKQAVFQGMASIFLPLVAVKAGQNIFAQFGKFTKDKISFNSQEHISSTAIRFIENGNLKVYEHRDRECIKDFTQRAKDSYNFKTQEKITKNPVHKLWLFLEDTFTKILNINSMEKNEHYANNTIKDIIEKRKYIINPSDEFKDTPLYKNYLKFKKDGQSESVAIKSVLKKYQQNKMLKSKFVKTLGGFIALASAIQPIDKFVDHILIGKYVGPQIDKISNGETKSSLGASTTEA